jgi:hypothetical protein
MGIREADHGRSGTLAWSDTSKALWDWWAGRIAAEIYMSGNPTQSGVSTTRCGLNGYDGNLTFRQKHSETTAREREDIAEVRIRFVLPFLLLWVLLGCGRSLASDLALVGAKIYLSPTEQSIERGSILIHDGRIVAVGPSVTVKIPRGMPVIDCAGLTVTAGFWNSHVHLILPGLLHAEKLSSEQLTSQLEGMLTRWGFTTVFDLASVLENTDLIRRRIESGEVQGPRLLTTGEPFWVRSSPN